MIARLLTLSNDLGQQRPCVQQDFPHATYPHSCEYTLSFPRFALSDGTWLYVADGGNDRVLEYETIPTGNAAPANIILGQVGGTVDEATDAADSMNTPTSLAWDGSNLYMRRTRTTGGSWCIRLRHTHLPIRR